MTRAKFRVESVEFTADCCNIKMSPVISGSEENKKFYKWTPSGSINLTTINKEAAAEFVPGKEMYIDFTIADK